MHAQAEVAQVAVGVGLLCVGAILVARRDEFEGGDQLPVEVDVDGALRVEAEGHGRFQVRLEDAGAAGPGLGSRSRPPLPDTDIRLAVARVYRQRGYAAEERFVPFRESLLHILQQVRQPHRIDAVPAAFVRPIVQRHGLTLRSAFAHGDGVGKFRLVPASRDAVGVPPNDPAQQPDHAGHGVEAPQDFIRVAGLLELMVRLEGLRCSLFLPRRLRCPIRFALCARSSRAGSSRAHPACVTGDSVRLGPRGYSWSVQKPGPPLPQTVDYLSLPSHSPTRSIRDADRQPIRYRTIVQRSRRPAREIRNRASGCKEWSPAPYHCVGR